jgi:hypothetical protein
MATVDKAFADRLKAGNGWVNGDSDNSMGDNPRATLIVEYDNAWGGVAYGVTFEGENNTKYLHQTPFVMNPRVYWEAPTQEAA